MNITSLIATLEDGSQVTVYPVAPVVPPAPEAVTEVDVVEGGNTEKFVPEAPAADAPTA